MSINRFMPEGWNDLQTDLDNNIAEQYMKSNEILQGFVKDCDSDFNLHIDFGNGIVGVIPRSEVEGINVDDTGLPKSKLCTGKVHKFVQFKITEIKAEKQLQLSRRQVQKEALNWVKRDLKQGQIINGIVKNIQPYGAFIEIGGGVVGLIHIEDLSIARIRTPFERLKIGQKINVMIKSINRDNGKVILSYKDTLGTWEENAKKFEAGKKTTGIVRETEKNKNGIFIELTPNLVGMAEYKSGLEYGQNVDVYIKKIDMSKKKVKLLII